MDCVQLAWAVQMKNEGKLEFNSYKSCVCTTNEQKSCTTFRELIGIVQSLKKYEHISISSDQFDSILNDHISFFSCFALKENFSALFDTAQTKITKFQKFLPLYTKGKTFSVADMLSRSFTQDEL